MERVEGLEARQHPEHVGCFFDGHVVAKLSFTERELTMPATRAPLTIRVLDHMAARAVGLRGGSLLVRPDGVPTALDSLGIPLAGDRAR